MADNASDTPAALPRSPVATLRLDPPAREVQANDPLSELARLDRSAGSVCGPRSAGGATRSSRYPGGPARSLISPSAHDPDFTNRRDPGAPGRRDTDWAISPSLPSTRYNTTIQLRQRLMIATIRTTTTSTIVRMRPINRCSSCRVSMPSNAPPPYEAPSEYGQGAADIPLYGDNGRLLPSEPATRTTPIPRTAIRLRPISRKKRRRAAARVWWR